MNELWSTGWVSSVYVRFWPPLYGEYPSRISVLVAFGWSSFDMFSPPSGPKNAGCPNLWLWGCQPWMAQKKNEAPSIRLTLASWRKPSRNVKNHQDIDDVVHTSSPNHKPPKYVGTQHEQIPSPVQPNFCRPIATQIVHAWRMKLHFPKEIQKKTICDMWGYIWALKVYMNPFLIMPYKMITQGGTPEHRYHHEPISYIIWWTQPT